MKSQATIYSSVVYKVRQGEKKKLFQRCYITLDTAAWTSFVISEILALLSIILSGLENNIRIKSSVADKSIFLCKNSILKNNTLGKAGREKRKAKGKGSHGKI